MKKLFGVTATTFHDTEVTGESWMPVFNSAWNLGVWPRKFNQFIDLAEFFFVLTKCFAEIPYKFSSHSASLVSTKQFNNRTLEFMRYLHVDNNSVDATLCLLPVCMVASVIRSQNIWPSFGRIVISQHLKCYFTQNCRLFYDTNNG